MKYLIEWKYPEGFTSKDRYFLKVGTNNEYTNRVSKAMHKEIPEFILKQKDLETRIIKSDFPVFKELIIEEIKCLENLIDAEPDYKLSLKKIKKILKEINVS